MKAAGPLVNMSTPITPQERLDKCSEAFFKSRYVSKRDFTWLMVITQAAINAQNGGNPQEIHNSVNLK